jgi:hypothetical protein
MCHFGHTEGQHVQYIIKISWGTTVHDHNEDSETMMSTRHSENEVTGHLHPPPLSAAVADQEVVLELLLPPPLVSVAAAPLGMRNNKY